WLFFCFCVRLLRGLHSGFIPVRSAVSDLSRIRGYRVCTQSRCSCHSDGSGGAGLPERFLAATGTKVGGISGGGLTAEMALARRAFSAEFLRAAGRSLRR